jgi:hypothetical protein
MSQKAGGNNRKIGRNKNKPWKARYDGLAACERNKRLNGETAKRRAAAHVKKWEKRAKKHKPMRGYARAMRRLHKQRTVSLPIAA